jgi:hypothetical protein
MFGEKVTSYTQYLSSTSGYIIQFTTSPNIRKVNSLQVINLTTISDVVNQPSEINELMQMPIASVVPDIAYSLQSGKVFIFFNSTLYPYTDDIQFLLMANRYPNEILSLDSDLDIVQGDIELFITLSIAIAAELQGKLIPQRVLDKIQYLELTIKMEK